MARVVIQRAADRSREVGSHRRSQSLEALLGADRKIKLDGQREGFGAQPLKSKSRRGADAALGGRKYTVFFLLVLNSDRIGAAARRRVEGRARWSGLKSARHPVNGLTKRRRRRVQGWGRSISQQGRCVKVDLRIPRARRLHVGKALNLLTRCVSGPGAHAS